MFIPIPSSDTIMRVMHCSPSIATREPVIPQHVLITGGAGFIGANFARFVADNHPETHITVLDALTYAGNAHNLDGIPPTALTFVHGDICNEALVERLLSTPPRHMRHDSLSPANAMQTLPPIDAIVHLAAESHNDNSILNADPFIRTNVTGTLSLLKAATRHNIRFHHISTDEVYGDLPLDSTDTFTTASPYRPSSPYSASKAASDHLVRAWVRTYGLRATISNCGNNYGPLQHIEKFIPRQITNVLSGIRPKLYGQGLEIRDWIHVEDHCSAIWEVLTRGRYGSTYLIGAHCPLDNITVLHTILGLMGQPHDAFDYVNNRPGVDRRYALDSTATTRELGWRPAHTDFSIGLKHTVEWYRDHLTWWERSKKFIENRYAQQGH